MKYFTLGCDPEFLLIHPGTGKVHNASRQYAAHDADVFGYDGNGIPAELRIAPCRMPSEAVSKIADILINYVPEPKILTYKWRAGAYYDEHSIGGHLHFRFLHSINWPSIIKTLNTVFQTVRKRIEPQEEVEKRDIVGYGQFHEENYRHEGCCYEYRPLLSWLVSPHVAFAYMCTAYACVHGQITNREVMCKVKHPLDLYMLRNKLRLPNEIRGGLNTMISLMQKQNIQWDSNFKHAWRRL